MQSPTLGPEEQASARVASRNEDEAIKIKSKEMQKNQTRMERADL